MMAYSLPSWVLRWAEKTTIHGIRAVVNAKSLTAKIAWFAAFLIMLALTAYQAHEIVSSYAQSTVTIRHTTQRLSTHESDRFLTFLYCPSDWFDWGLFVKMNMNPGLVAYALHLLEDYDLAHMKVSHNLILPHFLHATYWEWDLARDARFGTLINKPHFNISTVWYSLRTAERLRAIMQRFLNVSAISNSTDHVKLLKRFGFDDITDVLFRLAKDFRPYLQQAAAGGSGRVSAKLNHVMRFRRVCTVVSPGSAFAVEDREDPTSVTKKPLIYITFSFRHEAASFPGRGYAARKVTMSPYTLSELIDSHELSVEMQHREDETSMVPLWQPKYMVEVNAYLRIFAPNRPCFSPRENELYPPWYNRFADCVSTYSGHTSLRPNVTPSQLMPADREAIGNVCNTFANMIPPCSTYKIQWQPLALPPENVARQRVTLASEPKVVNVTLATPSAIWVTEEVWMVPTAALLAQLGGLIGLFLGASVLSLFEVCELAIFSVSAQDEILNRIGRKKAFSFTLPH